MGSLATAKPSAPRWAPIPVAFHIICWSLDPPSALTMLPTILPVMLHLFIVLLNIVSWQSKYYSKSAPAQLHRSFAQVTSEQLCHPFNTQPVVDCRRATLRCSCHHPDCMALQPPTRCPLLHPACLPSVKKERQLPRASMVSPLVVICSLMMAELFTPWSWPGVTFYSVP